MSKALSLTDFGKLHRRVLAAGTVIGLGGLAAIATLANAAPGQRPAVLGPAVVRAPAPAAQVLPFSTGDRLAKLDQLQAELAQLKLEAEIAKTKADIRNSATGGSAAAPAAGALMPPLPALPGPAMNLPPLPSPSVGDGPARAAKPVRAKPIVPTFTVIEAWGSAGDRQAVIRREEGGDRIVRVGDRIGTETVASITGGVVTLRDTRGRVRTIN